MYEPIRGSAHPITPEIRRNHLRELLRWMTFTRPGFRDHASWMLSHLRDPKSLPGLIDLLQHSDEDVRRGAILTLVRYGKRARRALVEASGDENYLVSDGARMVLDGIQGRRSISEGGSDRTPLWFVDAARGEMSASEAVPDLNAALQSQSPTRRENAAFALGAYEHPDIVPALVESISAQEEYGRATVAQALGRLYATDQIGLLIDLLQDESDIVCEHAAISLGLLGDGTTVVVLLDMLDAPKERVRKWSSFALGELFETGAKRMIEEVSEANGHQLTGLVHALLHSQSEFAVPLLIELVHDEQLDTDLRVDIATEFKEFEPKLVVGALDQLMVQDSDSLLGRVARSSLKLLEERRSVRRWWEDMPSESIAEQMRGAHRRYIDRHGNVRHKRWMSSGAASLAMEEVRSVDRLTKREGFLTIEREDIDGPLQNYLSASWFGSPSCNVHAFAAGIRVMPVLFVPLLIDSLRDHDDEVRRAAAEALTVMGQPSIGMTLAWIDMFRYRHFHLNPVNPGEIETLLVPRLVDLLSDPRAIVRASTAMALGELKSAVSVGWLLQSLNDSAVTVQRTVRTSLGRLNASERPDRQLRQEMTIGGGVFSEVGLPYEIVWNADQTLMAVLSGLRDTAGHGPDPNWAGWWSRVAIYDVTSLACVATFEAMRIRSASFHPCDPILAIGTGDYDGGYSFQGHLYLWNFRHNIAADVFERNEVSERYGAPEICKVRFNEDGKSIELTARNVASYKERPANATLKQATLHSERWNSIHSGEFLWHELDRTPVEHDASIPDWRFQTIDNGTVQSLIDLAETVEQNYQPRWPISGVGWDAHGGIVALQGNELEIWHDTGERETRFNTELPAVQLLMSPDRCVAWINTEEQLAGNRYEWRSEVIRLPLDGDNTVVIAMDDGRYDLRVTAQGDLVADATMELYKQPKKIVAIDPLGSIVFGEIDASIPQAWVHIDSRMATEAYQIRVRAYEDHPRQPWVGKIDPKSPEIEWLFPCHATGGFYGEDEDGPFLIVSNPEPYRKRSRLQRLALDSGEIIWSKLIFARIAVIEPLHDLGLMVFTAPSQIGLVDLASGTLLDYQPVIIDGHATNIVSMDAVGPRIACGTVDGRIIIYRIAGSESELVD